MASYNKSASLVEENRYTENVSTGAETNLPKKSLAMAYLLWFPFGLFGVHRFYLGYKLMGILYMFTAGYCGIGWIVDGFCLPNMVKETNDWMEFDASHPSRLMVSPCSETGLRYGQGTCGAITSLRWRTLRDARILTLNPLGILGIQHVYLCRPWYRIAYSLTAGLFGIGWISDICRLSTLVNQANAEIELLRSGTSITEMKRQDIWDCKTSEAYIFGIPCGIFGMHHFYLGRYGFGFTYLFTFGLCGLGWLADLLRMPNLVQRVNQERKGVTDSNVKYIDDAYILAFPLGIFGAHHFYLNRPGLGIVYFCTLGIFGLGWIVDLFRMPALVRDANLRIKQSVTFFHFPARNQYSAYPVNSPYPTAPLQNDHPTQNNYSSYPGGYQSTEQPPSYSETVSNQVSPNVI
ncbi:uncharacterized protein [Amphiura filiformis]|uniref:uncharacterized protein n=1 Tax=Amphiura filiformis TaxID=82378 RepID=UPI003B20CC42